MTLDLKLAIQILMEISMLLSVSKETKIELEFLCKRQNILYNLYFLTRNLKKTVIKITYSGVKELFTMFILEFSYVTKKNLKKSCEKHLKFSDQ
ncbi:hypothetical protein P5673_010053 [Acropora cervicornis]|uniref:Uncharacterized protein n=1 Tax=Acropora cervicornis TaxID=6130 RepID=A0AAD9V942_ACRCE|nr:hypothetical protein P5673_010053 [Acropora cervicornis]